MTDPLAGSDTSGHEQVVIAHDGATGLRAVVAIHSTALGPALGGTRMWPYADLAGRARRRAGPGPGDDREELDRGPAARRRQGRDHR